MQSYFCLNYSVDSSEMRDLVTNFDAKLQSAKRVQKKRTNSKANQGTSCVTVYKINGVECMPIKNM